MKDFTGTVSIMYFIFKKDKISLLCWVLLLPLLPLMSASAVAKMYAGEAALQFIVASVNANPLEVSMLGQMLAPNLGAVMCWKWLMQSAIFLGIFNLFFVIKHTRGEEANGRYELLSSTAIGRYAIISATLAVAFITNFLIGTSIFLYLSAYNLPFLGSLALGVSAWLIGIFMASLSAFAAQLTREPGTAKGIIGVLLATFYFLNIAGNSGISFLLWLSPISWLYKIRPFAGENWNIVFLLIGATLFLIGLSFFLLSKREIGVGFWQFKEKMPKTSPYLNNSFALAWKLHQNMIFWWAVSLGIMGAICGGLATTAISQIGENEAFKAFLSKMGGLDVADMILTLMILFLVQSFAAYTILAIGKLQAEEIENRNDIILSVPLGRSKWVLSHLVIIFIGICLITLAFGGSTGFFYGLSKDNIVHEVVRLLAATFAFLPALCLFTSFSFFIFAISPQYFYLSWFALIFIVILDFVRELVPDIQWLANLSPFSHVPKVLAGETGYEGLIGLTILSLVLGGIGVFMYRKRDIL